MAKKNSRNNDLLKDTKGTTSPKIYTLLVDLVNEDKEKLAEDVLKIDYLITYASNCIKDKDFREAKEVLIMIKTRIDKLKDEGVNIKYIIYLYDKLKSRL
ncbi:hypothetical protein [Clostridium weizhouense]|uniref:Uncharacterized protein n=1 Tax=Clostridium weizhouense TaxID=2859781 RepID=A0ABS7ALH3_9CLOT|nr:hypothetical protein [Clostridium weizhouense]MBW6409492.1 hypothetical protein [Clostridium weizhouense]